MFGLFQDVRHAFRIYRTAAFSSIIAVLALAAAMACVTASFSLLSDLVLNSHAGFSPAGQVVTLGVTDGTRFEPLSLNLVEQIDAESALLRSVVGTHERPLTWNRGGVNVDLKAELVTRHYFSELRPTLRLGRGFENPDHQINAAPVVVISHGLWQRQFGASPDVIGRTLRLGAVPSAVMVGANG